jgi:hypothetical protein
VQSFILPYCRAKSPKENSKQDHAQVKLNYFSPNTIFTVIFTALDKKKILITVKFMLTKVMHPVTGHNTISTNSDVQDASFRIYIYLNFLLMWRSENMNKFPSLIRRKLIPERLLVSS